jgi:hypothetical protein
VIAYFGYWPDFADASIKRFSYNDDRTLSMAIFYIDADLGLAANVTLEFSDVSDLALTEIQTTNYIDALTVIPGPPITVEIAACSGLGGSFRCSSARVAEFEIRPS